MPKFPKSTKVFGARGVGYMVTDTAGNQSVVPFADAEILFPSDGNAGLVPPLPAGPGDTFVLVYNTITNEYSWEESTTIQGGGAVIPLVDGSEPPVFITDGAGTLIVVDYNP